MSPFDTSLRHLKSDEQGTVTVIFAFMLVLVLVMTGFAVDTGRAMQVASRTSSALDAAALAAAKAMREQGLNDTEVAAIADTFFKNNTQDSKAMRARYGGLSVDIDQDLGRVSLEVQATLPTNFTHLIGFDKFDIKRSSTAVYNIRDIELGMMLDVTGSMGGQKIADLRTAASDLVDILITNNNTNQNVRIALAPYSASVNAGAYSNNVTNPLAPSTDGCVIERRGGLAYDDAMPGTGSWISAADPSSPPRDIDPTERRGSYRCPTASVMPLTNDDDALKSRISSFRAGGWTAGHIGLAWAWYLVSPEWSAIWPGESTPVSYRDKKTVKAVVLMTDGNFNTAFANDCSAYQAEELCDAMKAGDKNIIVFSVAFQAPAAARRLLQDCASPDNGEIGQTYFDASNGEELRQAFASVAIQLNNLRLEK